jgi:hypothetical protein
MRGLPTASEPTPFETYAVVESDEELAARAQRGDRAAFVILVERYQTLLCGNLTHVVGDVDDGARSDSRNVCTCVSGNRRHA